MTTNPSYHDDPSDTAEEDTPQGEPFAADGDGSPSGRDTDDNSEYPDGLEPSQHSVGIDTAGHSLVWDAALQKLAEQGKFKSGDLDVDVPDSSTHKSLTRMERLEWLRRDGSYSKIWRLGPKAAIYLDVSDELVEQSKE